LSRTFETVFFLPLRREMADTPQRSIYNIYAISMTYARECFFEIACPQENINASKACRGNQTESQVAVVKLYRALHAAFLLTCLPICYYVDIFEGISHSRPGGIKCVN
jgi:hypothetical protein